MEIANLMSRAAAEHDGSEAMKLSQAALNLAHAHSMLVHKPFTTEQEAIDVLVDAHVTLDSNLWMELKDSVRDPLPLTAREQMAVGYLCAEHGYVVH